MNGCVAHLSPRRGAGGLLLAVKCRGSRDWLRFSAAASAAFNRGRGPCCDIWTQKPEIGILRQSRGESVLALGDGEQDQVVLSKSGHMRRLTIDVPPELHRRVKVRCAQRGQKMADAIRELLMREFPPGKV